MTDMTSTAPQGTLLQTTILQALASATVTYEHLRGATLYASPVELIVLAKLLKNSTSIRDQLEALIGAIGDPRVTPIMEVENIPVRTLNVLIAAGLETMEAAQALDEKLLDIEGFGCKALAQVRAWKKV